VTGPVRQDEFDLDVVVIGGCGHVGLPLAIALADRGARVGIYDVSQAAVEAVNSRRMPFAEPGAEEVLQRVCAEHDCRLFAGSPVKFVCRCDASRVRSVLRSLGVEELRSILDEQGAVSVTCEFCGRPYQFDAIDVERLFAIGAGPESPQSLN